MGRITTGTRTKNEIVRKLSRRILIDHLSWLREKQRSGETLSIEQMNLVKDCWKTMVQDKMIEDGVTPFAGLTDAQVLELHRNTMTGVYERAKVAEKRKRAELVAPEN